MPDSREHPRPPSQGWSVLFELDSAGHLLATGARILQTPADPESVRDPILTLWSIGVEKLLKVSLGLREAADGHPWPDFKRHYGHGLLTLHDRLHSNLEEWTTTAGKGYVASLLGLVAANPIWPKILDALDCYAREGRFYRLDELGGVRVDKPVNAGRKLTPCRRLKIDPPGGLDYLVLRCARVR